MSIDFSKLKYRSLVKGWLLHLSEEEVQAILGEQQEQKRWGYPLEIVVEGDEESYPSEHLPFIEKAISQLYGLAQKAEEYLKAFLNFPRIGSTGETWVDALEFGTWKDAEAGEFEMLLTLSGDNYGLWIVRFRYSESSVHAGFVPMHFSRTQE